MSLESERLGSVTDILIAATERADELEKIIVVAITKNGEINCYTNSDPATCIGMIEIAKVLQLNFTEE